MNPRTCDGDDLDDCAANTKILTALLVLTAVAAGVGGLSVVRLGQLDQAAQHIHGENAVSLTHLAEVQAAMLDREFAAEAADAAHSAATARASATTARTQVITVLLVGAALALGRWDAGGLQVSP